MESTLNKEQLSLLELLAEPLSEEDLKHLNSVLVQFRYNRLQKMINSKWDEKGWSQEAMDKWYKEHINQN